MNAKTIVRVLFIVLAALALTALVAGAQDAPSAPEKALPAVIEKGESASPAANLNESEPNNSFAAADVMQLGDVISGKIGYGNDRDYFRIDIPDDVRVLIDVDAQAGGSTLDSYVCLFDIDHVEIACNDDSDGLDSLVYHGLSSFQGSYFVRVQDLNYPNEGGNSYTYTLSVYQPLLVSAAKGGTVAGIKFAPADVLSHYDFADGTEKWMLFFDASDVGITKNVVGLAAGFYWTEFALQASQSVWAEGEQQTVTPYDTLWFETPEDYHHYGPSTSGVFFKVYRGAESGLTGTSERIDAISYPWVVSTVGAATYYLWPNIKDEDLGELLGLLNFDGSNVSGLAAEDVVGADQDHYAQFGETHYWLTILGSGVIDGQTFTQKDIFVVGPDNHVTGLYWRGPDHHFNYNIDAFDVLY